MCCTPLQCQTFRVRRKGMADAARSLRRRPNRTRPAFGCTLTAEVDAALRARAAREGAKLSHVADAALRVAFGLPPAPPPNHAA